MKSTSAGTLEFYRLRDLVGRYVSSPLGRGELGKAEPHSDRPALEADLAETAEGIGYLRSAATPQAAQRGAAIRLDFNGIPELAGSVNKLRIEGASLEPKEMFDVFAFLDRSADARSVLNAVAERFPRLGAPWKARSIRTAASRTPPAWCCIASAVTSNARKSTSRIPSNGSSKLIRKKAFCRKSSSPFAAIASSSR